MLLMHGCGSHPDVPSQSTAIDKVPVIYPDYTDVTIPSNIAPINFMLTDKSVTDCVARLTAADGTSFTYGDGRKVMIDEEEWAELLKASTGKSITVEVFARKEDKWLSFKKFAVNVAREPVDSYISYRLIEPSYIFYDKMNISQRETSSFEEKEIFNNKVSCDDKKGQCINCHSYQNYSTDNMLFHVRVTHGGTVLVVDGKPRSVNLKRDGMLSAGVYPAWHPTEKLVAFSTDNTFQLFHTSNRNKVEVFDKVSDLVLYDVSADKVTTISADTTRLEVFPTWSGDGKWLYYCVADFPSADSLPSNVDYRSIYDKVHYNLYRRSFDVKTHNFGEEQLVYDAASKGRSVSLPRVSPDSRFVVFAEGDYGYFNIWHHEADIVMIDTATLAPVSTQAMNSKNYADSYPSFSSNGKWIMCASRRDDGNYSRVYMAYFDGKRTHKAFLLPQKDPEHNSLRLKSYNRPEFMKEPVKVSVRDFSSVVMAQ